MATGLTESAITIREAVMPVLAALARGTPAISKDDVDDLVSQVVEKVLRRLDKGVVVADLASFSKKAARNAFYDRVRRRGIALVLEPAHHDQAKGEEGTWLEHMAAFLFSPSPSAHLIAREDRVRHSEGIARALGQLSAAQRSVLVLRHGEGLTGGEIARRLGYKNAAVVDATASRARAKLEEHLSPSLLSWAGGR